jgi:hypothetical protein
VAFLWPLLQVFLHFGEILFPLRGVATFPPLFVNPSNRRVKRQF